MLKSLILSVSITLASAASLAYRDFLSTDYNQLFAGSENSKNSAQECALARQQVAKEGSMNSNEYVTEFVIAVGIFNSKGIDTGMFPVKSTDSLKIKYFSTDDSDVDYENAKKYLEQLVSSGKCI